MNNLNNTKNIQSFKTENLDWNIIQSDMKNKLGLDIYESWLKKIGFVEDDLADFFSRLFYDFIAGFVYISLYKMHQIALHGYIRMGLTTLANILTRKAKPRMKLH